MSGLILNSSGGGTINITAPNTANNITLSLPTLSGGTIVTTDSSNNAIAGAFIPSGSTVPTNGVYLPTSNTVAIATGGSERIRINTSGLTFPDASTQNTGGYTGFRNRIINGDMRIDQRNAGAGVTPTNTQYVVDRWNCLTTQSGAFSVQQNLNGLTPPTGFTGYLGAVSLTATSLGSSDRFVIQQPIEGYNISDLGWGTASAKAVVLSFWVRSSLTGTFGGSLIGGTGPSSYPFVYIIGSANTWEYKTITVTGPTFDIWNTTNVNGVAVRFSLGCGIGQSGTAGSWAASTNVSSATGATSIVGTSGATFYITGVQLEKGTVATPFEFRPYGMELSLCQRYYEKNCSHLVAPANGVSTGVGNGLMVGTAYSTTAMRYFATYKVEKRAIPTITLFRGDNANQTNNLWGYYKSGSGWAPSTTTDIVSYSTSSLGLDLYNPSAGLTGGYSYLIDGHWTASAEL